ncbi:MAG: LacI family DNA-binding transcriptional regulator [Deltaproteobacteria bacterium]|nr:LacI family DNA-binding transcriptional regulator [Deltaproteobacteria bacterium]
MAGNRMEEIARKARVSLATVSRSIHSPHLVKKETLEHIQRVMLKHRYVYNVTARDFSKKKSSVIGVIIPTTKGSIFSNSTQIIQEKAQEKGFSLIIANTGYDGNLESSLLRQFQERRLAGIILTGFAIGQESAVRDVVQSGIPCVVIWEALDNNLLSFVGFNNFTAAYSMTEYLIQLKHQQIGLILGPYSKVRRAKRRLEGYRAALKDYGLKLDPHLIIEKQPTLQEGKEGMEKLLSMRKPPTAVFAASDMLAVGALRAAREKGVRVPEDVSIAGFDDIDFAAFCNPPLTTVRVPASLMGEMAVETLMEMIEGKLPKGRQITLNTEIITRESCRDRDLK